MLLFCVKYNRVALAFMLILGLRLSAQDALLSQFYSSPLTINPANAGNFDGKFRFSSNFRAQWADFNNAYSTTTLTAETPILVDRLNSTSRVSLGTVMLNDASGNGLLTKQSMAMGVSLRKYLDEELNHSVAVGMQGAYVRMGFNASKAEFEDELSPTGFDLSTAETLLLNGARRSSFDFNVGLQYTGYFNNVLLLYAGASAYHLNRGSVSFLASGEKNPVRYNLHFGGYKSLGNRAFFHFSGQYQRQFDFQEITFGGALELTLVNKKNLSTSAYLGMWLRNSDFIIPYIGFDWNKFRMGFSYDVGFINRTDVTFASYQTGEISLMWLIKNSENIKSVKCPKF